MSANDKPTTGHYWHLKNIVCGHGRVIWSTSNAAWALPGLGYTQDESEARRVARAIDAMSKQYFAPKAA